MLATHVLLKFCSNWTEDVQIDGFLVVTRAYWFKRQAELSAIKKKVELNVGDDRVIVWSRGSNFVDDIEVVDLTQEQAEVLEKLFPLTSYHFEVDEGEETPEDLLDNWRQDILAGFGETMFLDCVTSAEH